MLSALVYRIYFLDVLGFSMIVRIVVQITITIVANPAIVFPTPTKDTLTLYPLVVLM